MHIDDERGLPPRSGKPLSLRHERRESKGPCLLVPAGDNKGHVCVVGSLGRCPIPASRGLRETTARQKEWKVWMRRGSPERITSRFRRWRERARRAASRKEAPRAPETGAPLEPPSSADAVRGAAVTRQPQARLRERPHRGCRRMRRRRHCIENLRGFRIFTGRARLQRLLPSGSFRMPGRGSLCAGRKRLRAGWSNTVRRRNFVYLPEYR